MGAPAGKVRSLYTASDNTLYAGLDGALYRFTSSTGWEALPEPGTNEGVENGLGQVNDLLQIGQTLYVGLDAFNDQEKKAGGLWEVDLNTFTWRRLFEPTVFSFAWRNGIPVATTWDHGVYALRNSSWEVLFSAADLPFNASVHAYAQLRLGDLESWDCFGLVNKGIGCIKEVAPNMPQRVVMLSTSGESNLHLDSDEIRIMIREPDTRCNGCGTIWVGSEGGGLDMLGLTAELNFAATPRPATDVEVGMGSPITGGGPKRPGLLGAFKPSSVQTLTGTTTSGLKVLDIDFDREGRVWVASKDGGVYYMKFEAPWTQVESAPANAVLFYGEFVVMGTDNGLRVTELPPR